MMIRETVTQIAAAHFGFVVRSHSLRFIHCMKKINGAILYMGKETKFSPVPQKILTRMEIAHAVISKREQISPV